MPDPRPKARWGNLAKNPPLFDMEAQQGLRAGMPLMDTEYGSRAQQPGHLSSAETLTGEQKAYLAAISRLMGPFKRAWEYPMLMQRLIDDPMTYLQEQMAVFPSAPNDPTKPPYDAILAENVKLLDPADYPGTLEDLLRSAHGKAPSACADILRALLAELEHRYLGILDECK